MIKKQYTQSAGRARNIIWNAAGRYDFEPYFMAFFPNGNPDHYFNMVVGLAEKWLDMDRLTAFFAEYERDRRADEFDDYLWLGIENCVYEKELPERPVLERLRKERALRFFKEQESMSRQQMEYQSIPVYNQQEARWAAVSGRRRPLLSAREKEMTEALRFPGELDTDGVVDAMRSFLRRFFRYEGGGASGRRGSGVFSGKFLRHEHRRHDHLLVRSGSGDGDHQRAVRLHHIGMGKYHPPGKEEEDYIRAVFGRNMLSEQELRVLTDDLCVKEDTDCRIWVTKGDGAGAAAGEAAEVQAARERQKARNEAFMKENAGALRLAVKKLSIRLETVFASYMRHLPEAARAGTISPEKAYRLPVLQDGKVFRKSGEETEQEVFADILLDASQSRMNSQEVIAAEAYIAARSFCSLQIPVRVFAFRSIKGFTVLEQLKAAEDRDCSGIARYYAGGWNRDALAIRTVGRLENEPSMTGKQRILLIMTDASPNDSAPYADPGHFLPVEYEGTAAAGAAENAVRGLREAGIMTGAVFHGNSSHLGDLHQIYGHTCVRIRKPSQLSQGLSDLLLMMLRETRTD